MTKIKKFQQGAVIDEDELFNDDVTDAPGKPNSSDKGKLDEELFDNNEKKVEEEEDVDLNVPPAGVIDSLDNEDEKYEEDEDEEIVLTGVEKFLTNYGVNGGLITYEDGSTAKFADLDSDEQSNILSSLISDSVPTIEEKFNLDEGEINLLNAVRDSNMSTEEFINDIVSERLRTVLATRDSNNTDYTNLSAEAIFVKSLKDDNPDITEEDTAKELVKAKELANFNSYTESLRKSYVADQAAVNNTAKSEKDAEFNRELEAQRHEIVQTVESISDIAGASITPQMKEYLLHDIMELNEDKDPILMEKIFSNPQSMFEANWFATYGKDHINQLNTYWKKEVSVAEKRGYDRATGKMSSNPTIIGQDGKIVKQGSKGASTPVRSFGKVVSEEELFEK